MKGQELIPLEDCVLETEWDEYTHRDVINLARLLKSTPKLGDFIPCDLVGNPLDVVITNDYQPEFNGKYPQECYEEDLKAYQEAERRVLWEGDWRFGSASNGVILVFNGLPKIAIQIGNGRTYRDFYTNKGLIFKRDL